ncbi:MAG: hypothetical protein RSF79_05820 [Janthinobacterium sp.]
MHESAGYWRPVSGTIWHSALVSIKKRKQERKCRAGGDIVASAQHDFSNTEFFR